MQWTPWMLVSWLHGIWLNVTTMTKCHEYPTCWAENGWQKVWLCHLTTPVNIIQFMPDNPLQIIADQLLLVWVMENCDINVILTTYMWVNMCYFVHVTESHDLNYHGVVKYAPRNYCTITLWSECLPITENFCTCCTDDSW